jgi:hypothetical protein
MENLAYLLYPSLIGGRREFRYGNDATYISSSINFYMEINWAEY